MAIILNFDTATLEGLNTTLQKATDALNAPLNEASTTERLKRVEAVVAATLALKAYVASIV